MAWQDTLNSLKRELANSRAARQERLEQEELEVAEERAELHALAESLGIASLLADMNATLLDGAGAVETETSWDIDPEGEADDEAEEFDIITTTLSWVEGEELEIIVDLGIGDDGTFLLVNGIAVRPDRPALEESLIEAFREELEL